MAKVNKIIAIVFLLISITFIAVGLKLPEGAKAYPLALAVMLLILSVLLYFDSNKKAKTDSSPNPLLVLKNDSRNYLILVISYVLFIIGLNIIGFIPASFFFVCILQYLLGYKYKLKLLLNSAIFTAIVYLSFSKLLNVPLPNGIFSAFL